MRDSVVCQHTDRLVWHILMNETHVQQIEDTVFSGSDNSAVHSLVFLIWIQRIAE